MFNFVDSLKVKCDANVPCGTCVVCFNVSNRLDYGIPFDLFTLAPQMRERMPPR